MTLFIFLIILSILVLIHEFGHFIAAKKSGVKVEEFALGFPPRIFSKKIGETRYSMNALPIGGYVRLFGEDEPTKEHQNRSFFAQPLHKKLIIALAGAFMNLLLGVVAFALLYAHIGLPTGVVNYPVIAAVAPGSPAQQSNMRPLDRILKVGDKEVKTEEEVRMAAQQYAGQEIEVILERSPITLLANMAVEQKADERVTVWITPQANPGPNEGALGIAISMLPITSTTYYPWYQMIPKVFVQGTQDSIAFVMTIATSLGDAVKNLVVHQVVPEDISGPVGIFQVVDVVSRTGFLPLLSLVGAISINLAVINALPFPGLDGARGLFVVIQAISRKKIAPHIEKNIHLGGLAILLLLVLLLSARDISRLVQ